MQHLYNTIQTYDLSDYSLPLPVDDDFDARSAVAHLFAMLRPGIPVHEFAAKGLKPLPVPTVKEDTRQTLVEKLIAKGILTEEARTVVSSIFSEEVVGSIGLLPSTALRDWPNSEQSASLPMMRRTREEVPVDIVDPLGKAYDGLDPEHRQAISRDDWIHSQYYATYDQLNELLCDLKNKVYERPFVVTMTNPEYYPIPGYTPEENILLGKQALFPNELMFTVTVENGQQLALTVIVREQEVSKEAPRIAFKYAVLAHLLAHLTGHTATQLSVHALKTHIKNHSVPKSHLKLYAHGTIATPRATIQFKDGPESADLFRMLVGSIVVEPIRSTL